MAKAILGILGSVFSWAAAKGIDKILGRWLAYFIIAFEERASNQAKSSFNEAIDEIKANSKEKAKAWDEWRKNHAAIKPSP